MPGSPAPSTPPPPVPDLPRAARLPSLTGMRFLAALLVFAFHTTFQTRFFEGRLGDTLGDTFANAGFYGVTFFFVLSGFVLTWSARPAEGAPRVWRRRLVKIFPNHLVTFVAAAALMAAASEVFTTKGVLANLFLVQAWIPEIQVPNTMNAVSWSLSCELFFYLAFPFLLPFLERLTARRLWTLAGVLGALTVLVPAVSGWAVAGTPLPFIDDGSLSFEQIWSVYFFPPVRAIEFVLGMIAARLVLTGAIPASRCCPPPRSPWAVTSSTRRCRICTVSRAPAPCGSPRWSSPPRRPMSGRPLRPSGGGCWCGSASSRSRSTWCTGWW